MHVHAIQPIEVASGVVCSMVPTWAMPALLTRMSSRPCRRIDRVEHRRDRRRVGDVAGDRVAAAAALREWPRRSRAALVVDVERHHDARPAVANRVAMAAPMPDPAPVTTATFPVSSNTVPGPSPVVGRHRHDLA